MGEGALGDEDEGDGYREVVQGRGERRKRMKKGENGDVVAWHLAGQ